MTFIDDYTRICWVYLLKIKSKYFETFHVWIENDSQSHIGSIHANNGKLYTTNDFENYIFQHAVEPTTTFPCNTQNNGVIEKMDRTILSIVLSMILFQNVKLFFWVDSIACALYVKNRCPYHI